MSLTAGIVLLGLGVAGPLSAVAHQESTSNTQAKSNSTGAPLDKKGANDHLASPVVPPNRSTTPPSPAPAIEVDKATYKIGIEDELQISVWHEPELSMSVVVRPDGVITLPLINDVNVVNLTPLELQTLLSGKLKEFVTEPQVTVIVRGIRSRKVYLVGEVARQGATPLNGNMTILELLAESGGLSPFAKSGSIYILRNQGGRQVRIPFDYKKAIAGRKPANNPVLQPGDVVVVP
jgi:polysaccharide export outer membrane protein